MNIKNPASYIPGLFIFLKETKVEGKRVNWPNRNKTAKDTLIVIVFAIVVALLLSTFDIILQCLFSIGGVGVCILF